MRLLPLVKIEVSWSVQRNRITIEKVRHQDQVAVGSKLVSDELSILKTMADNISQTIAR